MAAKRIEERVTLLESKMDAIMQKLERMEEVFKLRGLDTLEKKIDGLDTLEKKMDEIASRQTIVELGMKDRVKEISIETETKIGSSEARCIEKMTEVGEKCREALDKTVAIEVRLADLSVEWPTPSEGWSVVSNKRNEKKERKRPSFAEKFKNKPKDTMMLVGDSLTRGVGQKLSIDSHMVTTICRPGAHIEDITSEVSKLEKDRDRHLVLLVGTNNVKSDGSVGMLSKYKTLIEESKKMNNRKVSVVGIIRRSDLSNFENSRRLGVNKYLREMCKEHDVEYIEYEPANSRLAKDGLHLNHLGQEELGRQIFQHCRRFLV